MEEVKLSQRLKTSEKNIWETCGETGFTGYSWTPDPARTASAVAARLRARQKWEFKAQCLSVAAWLGGPDVAATDGDHGWRLGWSQQSEMPCC